MSILHNRSVLEDDASPIVFRIHVAKFHVKSKKVRDLPRLDCGTSSVCKSASGWAAAETVPAHFSESSLP